MNNDFAVFTDGQTIIIFPPIFLFWPYPSTGMVESEK